MNALKVKKIGSNFWLKILIQTSGLVCILTEIWNELMQSQNTVDSQYSRLQGTTEFCLLSQMSLIDNGILKEN